MLTATISKAPSITFGVWNSALTLAINDSKDETIPFLAIEEAFKKFMIERPKIYMA